MPLTNAEFLNAILPPMLPGEYGWWNGWRGNPRAKDFNWGGRPFDAPEAVGGQANQNTYFSVALLRGEAKGRKARQKATFSRLFCVVQDEGEPIDGLEPTWVLRTSIKGGAPNLQVGYRLSEPVTDPGVADRLHKGLAASGRIKADKSGNNIVRYVRLPVGSNGKYDPPHPHKLIEFNPERVVTLAEFCAAAGIDLGHVLSGASLPPAPAPAKARGQAVGAAVDDVEDNDFAAQVKAAAAAGRFAKSTGAGEGGSVADLGGRTPAMWRAHAVKCALEAAGRTHIKPDRGRKAEAVQLGAILRRDGAAREWVELAATKYAESMRDTNSDGEPDEKSLDVILESALWGWDDENSKRRDEPRQKAAQGDQGGEFAGDGGDEGVPDNELLAAIERENREFFVTIDGGDVVVARETVHPELGVACLSYLSPRGYTVLRGNEFVTTRAVGKDGEPTKARKPIGTVWLSHPKRRTFEKGVGLLMGKHRDGVYDLWKGLAVEPADGDAGPALRHIRDVICSGDEQVYGYLIRWLARCVQHPELRAEVAVVMRGGRGCGKGTLGNWMVDIFGRNHGMQILQSSHLTGKFNAHLRQCLFLFADEAFFAGDRQGADVLKGLVTEPHLTIERKGVDAVSAINRLKVLMATNHDWCVPAGPDERRYLVLDVADTVKQNHAYFDPLYRHMENGGLAALLHHLLHIDLTGFNVRDVPGTAALTDQKLQSLDPFHTWLHDLLFIGSNSGTGEWLREVPSSSFVDRFAEWAQANGHRYAKTGNQAVGAALRQALGIRRGQKRINGKQTWVWEFPELDDARKQFEANVMNGDALGWE